MRIIFILLLAFSFSDVVKASEIRVSSSFVFKIPEVLVEKADFPNLNSQYFTIKGLKDKITLIVSYNKPLTLANKFSVERYWNSAQNQISSSSKNIHDLGCERIQSDFYKCLRTSSQNGHSIAEVLFWKNKKDLVLMRFSSSTSQESVKKMSQSVQVESSRRKLAGAR